MRKILLACCLVCVGLIPFGCFSTTDENSIVHLERSAKEGNAEAQCALGVDYYFGLGVERDYSEAVKWWRQAAEQGNVKAQCAMGDCYCFGEGVAQDYSEAVKWYRQAAE